VAKQTIQMEKMVTIPDIFEGVFSNRKVVITGDSGFKGSWLAIWLIELGAEVYGYSLPPKTSRDNFVTTKLAYRLHHIDGDINDLNKLKSFFVSVQPDFAFHLAAQPLVITSYLDPVETFNTNILGVVNFFEAVRATPSIKVAINVTTDKCYQNNNWNWGYREIDNLGGDDPYSASKACSELITNSYVKSFFNKTNCSIASVRGGNVIGGGDWSEYRIVPDIFRSISDNKILKLRNPDAVRPWQFVLEPLRGYLMVASKLALNQKNFEGAWNFGPSLLRQHTVKDVLMEISKWENVKYEIDSDHLKVKEANLLQLDISKAINLLNWLPALTFSETIEFTCKGYTDELEGKEDLYKMRVQQINKYSKLLKMQ
jgi:CDP-glucose 4,6-dehydratase